jgi:hypothetical protein
MYEEKLRTATGLPPGRIALKKERFPPLSKPLLEQFDRVRCFDKLLKNYLSSTIPVMVISQDLGGL